MTVIKGRKYILAGNFPPEHKQHFIDMLTKELGIEIVVVITSDNTHFIEYDSLDSENTSLIEQVEQQKQDIISLNDTIRDLKKQINKKKKGWFR